MNGLKYTELYGSESWGNGGGFGIKISVAATKLPDLKSDAIRGAAYDAVKLIEAEVQAAIKAADPDTPERIKNNRKLVDLFPETLFVEEIPNGYCSDWCCRHLPWFIVTTKVGRIKIGWRKRVINIDWSETVGTKTAEELFPDEKVTKGDAYIHAWSEEDAERYIKVILSSA